MTTPRESGTNSHPTLEELEAKATAFLAEAEASCAAFQRIAGVLVQDGFMGNAVVQGMALALLRQMIETVREAHAHGAKLPAACVHRFSLMLFDMVLQAQDELSVDAEHAKAKTAQPSLSPVIVGMTVQ